MGLTYSDLQMMGSLYVFNILTSLPIAPTERPESRNYVKDSIASCSWILLIKIDLSSRKIDKMGPLTMFQRLLRDWRDKMSPQDISTKVKVGLSTDILEFMLTVFSDFVCYLFPSLFPFSGISMSCETCLDV